MQTNVAQAEKQKSLALILPLSLRNQIMTS